MLLFKPINIGLLFFAVLQMSQVVELMKVKFTSLKCVESDKSFVLFKMCRLKALTRHKVALNLHAELIQAPVTNISLNAELLRKANGFRPFLYNDTMNFCAFMRNPNRYIFWKLVFSSIKPYSNINHTCPYDRDVFIKDLVLHVDMFELIPFPANDYMFRLNFGAYNRFRGEVRAYFTIYD